MESISNAAQVASKYIFGEEANQSGTEPISGETGKGTVDEPYDAGNKEDGVTPQSGLSKERNTELHKRDSHSVDNPDGSDFTSNQQPVQKPESGDRPVDKPISTGDNDGAKDEDVAKDEAVAKDQNDAENKDDETKRGEEALAHKDPNDHSGEPLKMHDESEKEEGENKDETPNEEKKDSKAEGTGEKWVKTSGLAADGGDFDATKPGAGREADRLMEQKGMHKTEPGKPVPAENSPAPAKEKHSMGQKIKDKLHIGSGKHS